MLLQE